ncbi:MAG: hypothetical protein ACTTIS_00875 [Streptobacillus sp.]
MKERNFELIRGDDYSFLLKIKFPPNSTLNILACTFKLQARIHNTNEIKNSGVFLPRGQLRQRNVEEYSDKYGSNYLKSKNESKLVLSLSTENNKIKILDNGDLVLIFSHEDTDQATWKESFYDLQLITSEGKYKTIMRGKITLLGDITE